MGGFDIPIDITTLPYSERQIVAIDQKEVVLAARKTVEESEGKDSSYISSFLKYWLLLGTPIFGPMIGGNLLLYELFKTWLKAKDSNVPVFLITQEESKYLTLPPGHPRSKVLYVAHPVGDAIYYPLAEFHRKVFEHKFCEAIRIVECLGAKYIRVECIKGWSNDFTSRISVPIPDAPGQINGDFARSSKESSHYLYEANLDGVEKPFLPDNLVWFSHEPTWNMLAESRLKCGLKNFNLNVVYEDDYGINAGLKVKVVDVGFDCGGAFEDHKSTIWRISGSFV